MWKVARHGKPEDGIELVHEPLAAALAERTELTEGEWKALEVNDLKVTHWIQSGQRYLQPADSDGKRSFRRSLGRELSRRLGSELSAGIRRRETRDTGAQNYSPRSSASGRRTSLSALSTTRSVST